MFNMSADTSDDIDLQAQSDTEEALTKSTASESESNTEQAFNESSCYALCK